MEKIEMQKLKRNHQNKPNGNFRSEKDNRSHRKKKENLQRDSRVGNTSYLFVFWLICWNQKWAPFPLCSSHHLDWSAEAVSRGRCAPAQSWPGLKPTEMVLVLTARGWDDSSCFLPGDKPIALTHPRNPPWMEATSWAEDPESDGTVGSNLPKGKHALHPWSWEGDKGIIPNTNQKETEIWPHTSHNS